MPFYFATLLLVFTALPGLARATTGELPDYDIRTFCTEFIKVPESVRDPEAPATMEECLEMEKDVLRYLNAVTIFPALLETCVGLRSLFNGLGSYSLLQWCIEKEAYSLPQDMEQWTYLPLFDMEAMCKRVVELHRRRKDKPVKFEVCMEKEKEAAELFSKKRVPLYILLVCEKTSRAHLSFDYPGNSYVGFMLCFSGMTSSFIYKTEFPKYSLDKYCKTVKKKVAREEQESAYYSCQAEEVENLFKASYIVYKLPVTRKIFKACDARVRKTTSVGSYALFVSCIREGVAKSADIPLLER